MVGTSLTRLCLPYGPRAEKIVAIARRNGSGKREFSATGAWIRDRMLQMLLPVTSKGMDFMYAYDARAA